MRKFLMIFAGSAMAVMAMPVGVSAQGETSIVLYYEEVFYDGYGELDMSRYDQRPEILRHRNSLYAVKLTDEQMDAFGDVTDMKVTIGALCDNYDRIGNINIAFVPKGRESYTIDDADVMRSELGRFVTPFMDKNKQPDHVPYEFSLDNIGYLMHDTGMREKYDFWIEFELFGIPYAANTQITGCADRNDVFSGTLEFVTSSPAMEPTDKDVFIPIRMKNPEFDGRYNLNNYKETATDELGKTIKSYYFTLDKDVSDGLLCLITSNHGANSGGEEYNRRWHYVYVDDELVLTYKPGRNSCEPFRKYNTQYNGIYGPMRKSERTWQSFSNWCPGDVIDNRIIRLGQFGKGDHKITISVPDAVFNGQQGDIPVSIYFHGLTEGQLPGFTSIADPMIEQNVDFVVSDGHVVINTDLNVVGLELYDVAGRFLYSDWDEGLSDVDVTPYPAGIYLVNVYLDNGYVVTHRFNR